MNILIISKDLVSGDLAYRLKNEGHSVKLFIDSKKGKHNLDNLVEKTKSWRSELKWVGKTGLIVFDDVGYGAIQDRLRDEGYTVFGGSELGDRLETDREFGQEMFIQCGMKTVPLKDFVDIRSAINYVEKHPGAWVIKHNDHSFKNLTYIGHTDDGKDVIDVLKDYEKNQLFNSHTITLQEKIKGVEMGVGRYFNGTDWVGPIEINFEHTKLFPGDIGPTTSEMGTLAWYEDDENNKLFREMLNPIKPFLKRANFRGDFSVNCIINEEGAFPLEATSRIGSPIIHLQEEIHESKMGDFLYAVASGKNFNLKWKMGYGIVTTLAVPPYPYEHRMSHSLYGTRVYFDKTLTKKDFSHIHFEEIALKKGTEDEYFLSDSRGYAMYVTGLAETVEEARSKVNTVLRKIKIPQSFYRNDIGMRFLLNDKARMQKLGYITGKKVMKKATKAGTIVSRYNHHLTKMRYHRK